MLVVNGRGSLDDDRAEGCRLDEAGVHSEAVSATGEAVVSTEEQTAHLDADGEETGEQSHAVEHAYSVPANQSSVIECRKWLYF